MNILTKSDFLQMVKLNHLEVLTQPQIQENSKQLKATFEKALTTELAPEEVTQANTMIRDLAGFEVWQVLRDDLSKAILYTRKEQVLWEDAVRGEFGEIQKARGGVYKNTAENRKKGVVGQKYGEGKKEHPITMDQLAKDLFAKKKADLKKQGKDYIPDQDMTKEEIEKEQKINDIIDLVAEGFSSDYENVYELRDGMQEQLEEELKDAGFSLSDLTPEQHKKMKAYIKEEVKIFNEDRRN